MVGTNGLEPSTSRLSGVRSNHLSYAPIWSFRSSFCIPLVEMRRIELLTPCLQSRCSPSWATPPQGWARLCLEPLVLRFFSKLYLTARYRSFVETPYCCKGCALSLSFHSSSLETTFGSVTLLCFRNQHSVRLSFCQDSKFPQNLQNWTMISSFFFPCWLEDLLSFLLNCSP